MQLLTERRLELAQLPKVVSGAMAISAVIMAIVAVSNGFSFLVAQEQLPARLAAALAANFHEKWTMLLALNVGLPSPFFVKICTTPPIASAPYRELRGP